MWVHLRSDLRFACASALARGFRGQYQTGQGRQGDFDGVFEVHPGPGFGFHPSGIAEIAAAIAFGVGVEDLPVETALGDADSVVAAWYRGEVEHDHQRIAVAVPTQEAQYRLGGIVAIDPGESIPLEVLLVQFGPLAVAVVEVAHQALYSLVLGPFQEVPVEFSREIPFPSLAEFLAHE